MSNYINSSICRDEYCIRVNGRAICSPRGTDTQTLDMIAKFLESHADQLLEGLLNSGNQHQIGKQLKQYGYASKSTVHSA